MRLHCATSCFGNDFDLYRFAQPATPRKTSLFRSFATINRSSVVRGRRQYESTVRFAWNKSGRRNLLIKSRPSKWIALRKSPQTLLAKTVNCTDHMPSSRFLARSRTRSSQRRTARSPLLERSCCPVRRTSVKVVNVFPDETPRRSLLARPLILRTRRHVRIFRAVG